MDLYYIILFFVFGTVLGSFYNVVGYRLPNNLSLIKPSSHCPNCNHKLTPIELIPILSYLIQGAKCKNCKIKISMFYPIFEFLTGVLFVISYLIFGLSIDLIISLIFSSVVIIITVSDYHYMIISDEVVIVSSILILITNIFKGFNPLLTSVIGGASAFTIMFLVKLLGDKLFNKESLGGGDIKLMFVIGLVISFPTNLLVIALSAYIALPVALVTLFLKKENVIPYGPFLGVAALIIYFTHFNIDALIKFLM